MIKLIITGAIGSGKSSLTAALKETLGEEDILFVDFDREIDEMYRDHEFQRVLLDTFGTSEKKEISKLVFGGSEEQNKINLDMLNQVIGKKMDDFLFTLAMMNRNIVLDIPYFFSITSPNLSVSVCELIREMFTVVYVTVSNFDERVERIRERCKTANTHWTEEMILGAAGSQTNEQFCYALSDIVVCNDYPDSIDPGARLVIRSLNTAYGGHNTRLLMDPANGLVPARHNTFSKNVFRIIEYAYDDLNRAYHNVDHINEMTEGLFCSTYEHKDHISLQLAILFHDYIYDAGATDNELKSAQIMVDILKRFNCELLEDKMNEIKLAALMILSTQKHIIQTDPLSQEIYDLFDFDAQEMVRVFLDLDLMRFSSSELDTKMHDDDIRTEYSKFDETVFNTSRLEALKYFFDKGDVLTSKTFGLPHLQEQIKNNLKMQIDHYKELCKDTDK
jgi:predicted metal-dependent HD superfamily phosphohydrolase/dephospho-CoA kinase